MEDHAFDAFTKGFSQGRSRRALLKGILGFGSAAVVGTAAVSGAEAARRGYAGPLPKSTVVAGPPTCDPQTCYGCHQCVGSVCTDQPKTNCYDHTDQCLTSVCNPDGGCSYPFDCRVRDGCCGHGQMCNAEGQCVCDPSVCCGVECPGCQECSGGTCVRNPANCYDHTAECRASVCGPDGGCSYPFDCNVRAGCCSDGQVCNAIDGTCVSG
jgi:hypothetical protein